MRALLLVLLTSGCGERMTGAADLGDDQRAGELAPDFAGMTGLDLAGDMTNGTLSIDGSPQPTDAAPDGNEPGCGTQGHQCCGANPVATQCVNGQACVTGACEVCGGLGSACCPSGLPCNGAGHGCIPDQIGGMVLDRCEACGNIGEACCAGHACGGGFTCTLDASHYNGTCR